MRKRKKKPLSETVHPDILARAEAANRATNKHLKELRRLGYTTEPDMDLEASVLMVETASIIAGVEKLSDE